jgi:hypothetical protein
MNTRQTITPIRILFVLALATSALVAGSSRAQDAEDAPTSREERRGLFLGINAGFGGSSVQYKDVTRSIVEEHRGGALGALRFGYAFNANLALSLEGFGFGGTEDEIDGQGLGATLLVLTWHPCGKGFFLRGGVGAGGGSFSHPVSGDEITLKERGAGLFGIGYDWWVGDNTTLGLAFDGFSLDAGSATGFDDDHISTGGMTLQFNWYL